MRPFGAFSSVTIVPVAYTSMQVALQMVRGVARGKDSGVLAADTGGMCSGESINDLPVPGITESASRGGR